MDCISFTTGYVLGQAGCSLAPKTITAGGVYRAADDGCDGYDTVTVNIPISGKTVTRNGVYHAADDSLKGYDPVNVSVPMYWMFPPGETVPPSMTDPENPMEEDAPVSPDDVPHPTYRDPHRVIKPQFKFINKGRICRESDGLWVAHYGGELYDAITGELLETRYIEHPWINESNQFHIVSWDFNITGNNAFRIEYNYDSFIPPGSTRWESFVFGTNVGSYTASSGSGQNSTTVYGG